MATNNVWGAPVTLAPSGQTFTIAVAPNDDVLPVCAFRTTNTYIPDEAQGAFYRAIGHTVTISTMSIVYGNVDSRGLAIIDFDRTTARRSIWTNSAPMPRHRVL